MGTNRLFILGMACIFAVLSAVSLYAQKPQVNPAEEVFGKNFKLTVDPTSGTLKSITSEKTNTLESIEAKKDVHVISDKLELFCDELYYDAKTQKYNASGKRVKIVEGTLTAFCGKFTYDHNLGLSEFLINPEIIIKDEQGRKTITKGDRIKIERQKNGDTLVQVEGNATLTSEKGSGGTPKIGQAVAPAQKMFGREFKIITGEKGEILYVFSDKNELKSIVAREEVYINSEQVDLRCGRLEYFSDKNKLLAMGKPVKILEKTLVAEAGRFEYYPDDGKSYLMEDPVIKNSDVKGRNMETRGDKITIVQSKEGRTIILVEGGAEGAPSIQSAEMSSVKKSEPAREQTPLPVDESNVDQIKNAEIRQD